MPTLPIVRPEPRRLVATKTAMPLGEAGAT